jgi:pimeloyl-ACP methyl ester carboxylesterase
MTRIMVAAALFMAAASGAAPKITGGPSWPGNTAPPERVFDGDPKTYWAGDPKADRWQLDIDLGEVRELPAITIDYFSDRYMARDTTADISADGTTWQPIGALPATDPSCQPVGQPARFVRLQFVAKAKDKQPAIREIRFEVEEIKENPVRDITYPSSADDTMQPARYFSPNTEKAMPLVVGLHTWSGDYRQRFMPGIEAWCIKQGWAFIHPNFRGPNWTPQATGSDLVVADILSAIEFAKKDRAIDPRQVYLVGGSGGGYHALLMAGRAPSAWAGVSAWVPITDLAAWYRECRAKGSGYADHIVKSCGGAPGDSPEVDEQLRLRSPLTHLAAARGVRVDINAGIHDGHRGSVPISHSLRAFNVLAAPEDRIADADIAHMVESQEVPEHLRDPLLHDDTYGEKSPLLRRESGTARITIFDGGHELVEEAAIQWLLRRSEEAGNVTDREPR